MSFDLSFYQFMSVLKRPESLTCCSSIRLKVVHQRRIHDSGTILHPKNEKLNEKGCNTYNPTPSPIGMCLDLHMDPQTTCSASGVHFSYGHMISGHFCTAHLYRVDCRCICYWVRVNTTGDKPRCGGINTWAGLSTEVSRVSVLAESVLVSADVKSDYYIQRAIALVSNMHVQPKPAKKSS